jgi:hypothetical protein
MRKMLAVVGMMAIMGLQGQAFGFGLPSALSGGAKVDVTGLNARADKLKLQVTDATISLGEGTALVLAMTGKTAEANKLTGEIEALKKNKGDLDKSKGLADICGNATKLVPKLNAKTVVDTALAQTNTGTAALKIRESIDNNKKAVGEAKALSKELSDAVKSNPAAATELTGAIDAAKYVSDSVPSQISMATDLGAALADYAKSANISLP